MAPLVRLTAAAPDELVRVTRAWPYGAAPAPVWRTIRVRGTRLLGHSGQHCGRRIVCFRVGSQHRGQEGLALLDVGVCIWLRAASFLHGKLASAMPSGHAASRARHPGKYTMHAIIRQGESVGRALAALHPSPWVFAHGRALAHLFLAPFLASSA